MSEHTHDWVMIHTQHQYELDGKTTRAFTVFMCRCQGRRYVETRNGDILLACLLLPEINNLEALLEMPLGRESWVPQKDHEEWFDRVAQKYRETMPA